MTNAEMSLKTKQALASALKDAMQRKALSKITVSELCAACNINRNTFYYHFRDVYDLLKWMLEQEAIEVVKSFDLIVNTEEAFRFIMRYVGENRHIINCAYDSMGHEEIKRFFYTDLIDVMKRTISGGEEELNITVDDDFKEFLAVFYTEASAGILIDWIKNKFRQDEETLLEDLLLIYRSSMPQVLLAGVEKQNGGAMRKQSPGT
ncbi:MAG: TetR/AcrR family transcriptional regulator C-terminal domain-containing protein [Oscillospiraceae bacterium]|nr:TetR/AcrR family transcriptional regulator C-terminal domain-containing protein [Oscillospiraceae bacterium]